MTYERINFIDQSVERPRTYEMTHNADGSVTLVDSFGLVDELGTPINADTMNYIEDGIVNNDNRITYLEDRQIVDYKIQNMLTTGSISTDEQGYNQLEDMYHSTFDLSKFEVVGSPNITSDGVASGFSNSNYITVPLDFSGSSDIDFNLKWVVPSENWSGGYIVLGGANDVGNGSFQIYHYVESLNVSIFLNDNGTAVRQNVYFLSQNFAGEFKLKILKIGTNYKAVLINPTGEVLEKTFTGGYDLYVNSTQTIGRSSQKTIIDLKQFSITVDGIPVFNGNKTGLDVIKPDNYTVVGSPTITADGIASGFNANNYITTSDNINLLNANSWKISCEYNLNSVSEAQRFLFGTTNTSPLKELIVVQVDASKDLAVYLSSDGSNFDIMSGSIGVTVQENISYLIEIEFTGTAYNIYVNGELKKTVANSNKIQFNNILRLNGVSFGATLFGSSDLNAFKIYVDGNLVYQPCLKIPYTESKTGSKIVDAVYRDRVEDVYEQYGQAEYYTIDEENKNFTLPMGEIYGMMVNKDLSNVEPSQSFIDTSIRWGMPDYSAGIEISFPVETAPFTAPTDGLYITNLTASNRFSYLYINDLQSAIYRADATGGESFDNFIIPLSKGDVIYWDNVLTATTSTFYPLKGAK